MSYSYSSVQVTIKGQLRKQILKESMRIQSKDLYTEEPEYGRDKDPHLTVKYGVHTTYPTEVKPLFKGIDEIEFELGEVTLFDANPNYDVVKFTVIDKKNVRKLNRRISEQLECTDTFSRYNPHVTLAYVKKGAGKKYKGPSALTGKTYRSNEVTFSGHEDNRVDLDLGYTEQDADNCIGVDFDGTLAKYTTWKGWRHLGDPVPAMVNRVKNWLKQGQNVKIFTARYSGPKRDRIIPLFNKWCSQQGLPALELTNEKTPGMHELWDDRAVRVVRNRGITKAAREFLETQENK